MKIAFKCADAYSKEKRGYLASSRIRCHWLSKYWKEADDFFYPEEFPQYEGDFFNPENQMEILKDYDVIILNKTYEYRLAEMLRRAGKIVIVDMCVSGDSLIMTDNGWKFANEISLNDKLLTHKGVFKSIKNIFKRKAFVKALNVYGLPNIKITGNHPILSNTYYLHNKCFSDWAWLNVNDQKVYFYKKSKEYSYIASLKNRYIKYNKLSNDYGWFWGYYSAEGSRNKNIIQFSSNKNETSQREKISRVIKLLFNKNTRIVNDNRNNTVNLVFSSRKLSRFIKDVVGININKTVVPDIFNASVKTKLAFLEGYIAGDGYCNDYGGISVSSVSKKLAYSVWQLFRDCGIFANINYHKRDGENCCFIHKNGKKYDGNPCWRVQLNPKESIKFYELTNIKKFKKCKYDYWNNLTFKGIEYKEINDYCAHSVKDIEDLDGELDVYNFEVNDDNSYITDGIIVHNCDPDHLSSHSNEGRKHDCLETLKYASAVVVNGNVMKRSVREVYKGLIEIIPDRMDIDSYEPRKMALDEGIKSVVWYGYSENLRVLEPYLKGIINMGIEITIISDKFFDNLFLTGCKFNPKYMITFKNYDPETFNSEVIKHDVVFIGKDKDKYLLKFKSNNRALTGWCLGMPVAFNIKDLKNLITMESKVENSFRGWILVNQKYDCRQSVEDYKNLINKLFHKQGE